MKKLLLATNNIHKVSEIRNILVSDIEILTLTDFNINIEIKEDKDTLEGNSLIKAEEVFNIAKIPTLADDTGLYVTALNGQPGVFSSRYAGENATYDDNCKILTFNMNKTNNKNRSAFFRTVICYYLSEGKYYFFEGICKGKISTTYRGTNGFGYDPLFIPEGFNKTYAELTDEEKNKISHRSKALTNFKEYYKRYLT